MPHVSRHGLIAMNPGSYEWPTRGVWCNLIDQFGPGLAIGGWFTDNTLCFVQAYHVYTIHVDTGELTDWGPWQGNSLFAGGGVWAVGNQYRDSWGPNPYFGNQGGWVPFAVDDLTGAIAVLLPDWRFCVYQGHQDPSQAVLTPILSGVTEYQASFTGGVLTVYSDGHWYHWTSTGGLTHTGVLTRPEASPGAQWSQGWNLGWSPVWYGQVIWPDWNPEHALQLGWIYNYNAKIYRPSPDSPIVQVIGSRGPGELPGEQQVFTFNLTDHTFEGRPWTVVNLIQPPPPIPPEPPIPPIPPIPPQPPVVMETDMIVLKRSRLSLSSTSFPGRKLCLMNNGEFLHVDPTTMGVYQSKSDDDKAAWITTAGSGVARLEIEAYFIEAKVDEKA